MRFLRIQVKNVRSIQGPLELRPGPGLNLVHGPNETGKSTLFDAVWAALHFRSSATAAAVRALEPWSGEAPEVTLEFEVDGSTYELYKRWSGSGVTRLEKRGAPGEKPLRGAEAEAALEKLLGTHDKKRSAWPLLRVAQGDSIATVAEMLPAASREALAAGLSGLAAAGTGMETLVARVEEAYAAYFTDTGRERRAAGAPKHEAEKALAEAERALAEHRARRDAHEQELRDWEAVVDELARLERERPDLVRALDRAAADEAEVRRLLAERSVVAETLRTAVLEERAAVGRLNDRRRLRAGLAADEKARDEKRTEAERCRREAERRKGMLAGLEAALEAAKTRQTAVEERHEALFARSELLRAEAELRRLDGELAAARELRTRIVEREAVRATLPVDVDALRRLEDLEGRRREAAAALHAASTTVRLRALRDVPVAVGDETLSLAGGDVVERELSAPTLLRLGDLALVEVVPGGAGLAGFRRTCQDLEARLASALAALGVPGLDEARRIADERRKVEDELRGDRNELARRFSRGTDALEGERDAAANRVEEARTKPCGPELDAETVTRELALARAALGSARTAVADATRALEKARLEHAALEKAAGVAGAQATALEEQLAKRAGELARSIEADGPDRKLEEDHIAAANRKGERAGALETIDEKLRGLGGEAAAARLARAREALERHDAAVQLRKNEKLQRETRLASADLVGLSEKLRAAQSRVADRRADFEAQKAQAEALRLLRDTIRECEAEAKGQLVEPMQRAVKPILEEILGPATLELDGQLEIVRLVRSAGAATPEALSHGAREQVSLAVRLAMAQVLAGDGKLPVFLDDAFVWSDAVRFENVVAVLSRLSGHLQILVATCHPERWEPLALDPACVFDLARLKQEAGELQAAG